MGLRLGGIVVLALLLGVHGRPQAASLKVGPARFMVQNVKPGKSYDIYKETGLRLTVYNDDEATRTWVLTTHRPSERGRWEKGYAEIPDPRWCWFEKDEITVPPHNKAYAKLFLRIPEEEKYYNQHWIVTLGIGARPGRGGVALAVDVRIQIETGTKTGLKTKPHGLLGLEPAMVRFKDVTAGKSEKKRVVLYNNDDAAHGYTIRSLFADSKIDRRTYLTQGYEMIPDSGWIRRDKRIRIEPKGSAVLPLELNVPADAGGRGKKWEDILLIQPDKGRAGFVRVQVQTPEKKGEK